jgi:hypothetical protein
MVGFRAVQHQQGCGGGRLNTIHVATCKQSSEKGVSCPPWRLCAVAQSTSSWERSNVGQHHGHLCLRKPSREHTCWLAATVIIELTGVCALGIILLRFPTIQYS